MMKFHAALSSAIATVLVVPAVVPSDDPVDTLESALSDTVRALEVLAGIQSREASEQPVPTGLVKSVTESPILDARSRDERLVALRNEVNLLQTELDVLEAPTVGIPTPIGPSTTPNVSATGAEPLPAITTGLNDELRRTLHGLQSSEAGTPSSGKTSPTGGSKQPGSPRTPKASVEHQGYSANPVGQAQACYRAGLYEKGVELLKDVKGDTKALYWRARCLEKLDRFDEAIADLKRVTELSAESYEARRAKADLEFVEWKKGFVKRLPEGAKPRK